MNISIILYQPYPVGMACTNRIHNYAKGIIEQGGVAKILVPKPTEMSPSTAKNIKPIGIYKSVEYFYTCGATVRPPGFVSRRLVNFRGMFYAIKEMFSNRKKLDAILLVTNNLLPILLYTSFAKACGIKVVLEKSELPFYNKVPVTLFDNIYQYLYTKYCFLLFDGIIVISKTLNDYFITRIKRDAKLLLVPIIMDPSEFLQLEIIKDNYITYCGNFTQQQDGILTLIKAFKVVLSKNENVRLRLVGESSNKSDMNTVLHLIEKLNISNRVEMTGFVTREKLVEHIASARILVLAKPQSVQSGFCFPSKLAEYLMTGNPVVVTNVGAIRDYLVDDENAYLTKPDCTESLAQRVSDVLNDNEKSNKIGAAGRDLALKEFSYQKQGSRIIDFIDKMIK